jgi:2-iminobutanoate/2-iminopropanoate deaminase
MNAAYALAGSSLLAALAGCMPPGAAPSRQLIATPDAPAAIGPYSQAVHFGDLVFVSGQLGLDPKTGKLVPDGIKAETHQAMKNLAAILAASGLTLDDALQVTIYVVDLNDFAAVNEIYGTYFKVPPTRVTVQVARLPRDGKIEIALTAGKLPTSK